MDCREFRDNHALLIDLQCSALDEQRLQAHIAECAACAHHDSLVRRSLLLVKNLPSIEPSPDFRSRLDARLQLERSGRDELHGAPERAGTRVMAVAAAGVAFLALAVGYATMRRSTPEIRLAPVVASRPVESSPAAVPALVATVPTGMSVWPAIMVASQAPVHFVATELATER